MKKLIFILSILFSTNVFAQYQIEVGETVANKRVLILFAADLTDGVTPELGLTITCQRKLPAATSFSACTNATVVEVGSGVYQHTIDPTEVSAEGTSAYLFTNAAMRPSRVPVQVKNRVVSNIKLGR